MNFTAPLIAVKDMKTARAFYENVQGQEVTLDLGQNVTMNGKFALQEDYAGLMGVEGLTITTKGNDHELYFDEEDFDSFIERLNTFNEIAYVHKAKEYPWGQRVVRFYDPDGHIIEVGESMESLFKRFAAQGMTVEEVAARTMHPVEFVKLYIK
jgi:catechol 2,3-dioxygenase-like lactoylglutathione lyase family enzyme